MTQLWRHFMFAAVAMAATRQARAQCPVPAGLVAQPGTIIGIVADTSGVVVDNVDIYLASPRRRVLAANGRFRLDSLAPGEYQISSRRLGYAPQSQTVTVGAAGGVTAFCLVPAARKLLPIVSSVPRGGLAGLVTDTLSNAIADAEITVIGAGGSAVSDDKGGFFIDLKPGHYMVRVKRPWFEVGLGSVTIPPDSGRQIHIWLTPTRSAPSGLEENNAADMAHRINGARPARTKYYTREDIDKTSMTELVQLARAAAVLPFDDTCPAIVNGGPHKVPLWSLKAADIEMLEVYTEGISSSGAMKVSEEKTSARCPSTIYAWLRK